MSGQPDPRCKIGRIILRGGAELRVYQNHSPFLSAPMRRDLLRNAKEIHDGIMDMAGFVIVAWARSGTYLRATRVGNGTVVGETMLPAYVSNILQRDIGKPNDFNED